MQLLKEFPAVSAWRRFGSIRNWPQDLHGRLWHQVPVSSAGPGLSPRWKRHLRRRYRQFAYRFRNGWKFRHCDILILNEVYRLPHTNRALLSGAWLLIRLMKIFSIQGRGWSFNCLVRFSPSFIFWKVRSLSRLKISVNPIQGTRQLLRARFLSFKKYHILMLNIRASRAVICGW